MLRNKISNALNQIGLPYSKRQYYLRRIFEFFGSSKFSIPSEARIQETLMKYMGFRNGFFVEAGAHDGYSQSNTYFLEKFRNWHGILIEPIPELYEKCQCERRHSKVFNCALVADSQKKPRVNMIFAGLISVVEDVFGDKSLANDYVKQGLKIQNLKGYEISVPARTLSSIIDESKCMKIDLLAIDVEGYELETLKGLQMDRHCPRFLLVEAWNRKEVENFLTPYFDLLEVISRKDDYDELLFKAKNERIGK